jgi:hypothetical protein
MLSLAQFYEVGSVLRQKWTTLKSATRTTDETRLVWRDLAAIIS